MARAPGRRLGPDGARTAAAALALGATLLVATCGGGGGSPTRPGGLAGAAQPVREHLLEMIGLMREFSFKRDEIDWFSMESVVLGVAYQAQTIFEALPAINTALERLDDGHTSYLASDGRSGAFFQKYVCDGVDFSTPVVPESIAYVHVGRFSGVGAPAVAYANEVQDEVRAADRDGLIGWIVDLRGNGGGNVWPMLAGAGPVIGEGVVGYAFFGDGTESAREYRGGTSYLGGNAQISVGTPYRLRRERPRVAVLTDGGVASSGEALTLAFKGRPDTRSFGLPTCGLSTGRRGIAMSNGAVLNLAVSIMGDRNRVPYGEQILPDELVSDPDEMVSRAIAWLQAGS